MPAPTLINLTANATYTAAAGDYAITGLDGNDTITTGAGNSSVTTGTGNSTITTGAGDSLVHTLDGNQTITTGAGNSTVITGAGNSTITTGAGISTVQAGNGNNTITTGAGASHITTGMGDDTITSGAGNAVVDSGTGNDTVTTGAGNDLVSYHVTDNAGTYSLFTAAAGIDTLNLVMTRAEWMSDAVQSDVASYLDFLAANKGASGEDGAAAYAFKAFGLTASMFENLQITVDGVVLQDATNHTVALHNDAISTTEKVASLALNVLANDAVPDLIKSFSHTNPEHGSVHLDAAYLATASAPSAQFIYTPTPGYYDYLAVGESASDAFTYAVTDAAGGVNTATVSVTIIGTNDAPVITSAVLSGAVTEQVTPVGNLISSGAINFSDVDLSDVHTVSAVAASSGTLGTLTASVSLDDSHTTGLGGQVSWAYSVADFAVEYLAAGETKVESFTVSLDDGHGGVVPSTVSVTITGTNDAPVITSSAQAGAVQEDVALTASGTVTSSDVDNGATATYSGSATGAYGSFAVAAGTGAWTYTLDNAHHQALAQGESHTETFLVTVTDDKGAAATQNVVLTITGTNDAPVITSSAQAGAVKEDVTLTATGTVTSSDVDNGATATYSGSAVGTYGSFAVAAGTGAWTYTLDNAHHQALAQGESHTETFLVTVTDDKGAIATQAVALTITGTNDAPVITSSAQAGAVQEDVALTASGTVTSSDVDNGATATYTGSATGTYGSFAVTAGTGAWTYTLDNAHHQALAQGESHTETFLVTVTDDKGAAATQNVVLTITGTNDAPVITSSAQAGAVKEDVTLTATGTVTSSDVDNGATATYTGSATGTYGSFAVTAGTGVWTYTLDNAHHQALAQGESHTESFLVTVTDDKGAIATQAVALTITGTNDAPVIGTAVLSGTVTEQDAPAGNLTSSGAINFSDVDLSDSHTVSAVAASSGTLGTLTASVSTDDSHTTGLGGVVTWNYSVADSAVEYLAAGQTKVETFTVSLSDGHGSVVPSTVSVTITGTNEAPVIGTAASSFAGAVTEQVTPAGNLTSIGAISFSDVDLSDVHTVTAAAASSGTLGTLTASVSLDDNHSTGLGGQVSWAYSVDNAKVQYLAAGETKVETFTVTLSDGHGGVVPSTVSVTITGTNEAPVINIPVNLPFAAHVDYATGSNPIFVTSADVNGDGKADLIVANQGSNNVSVLLGKGDGTFAAHVDYAAGSFPIFVKSADVNGDGKADLIVANPGSSNVSVLLGKGDGTFAAHVDYATGSSPYTVTSADVNGDGKADLIVANYGSNNVSVLLGKADGTFAAHVDYAAGSNPIFVTSADVNGDGKADLIVTNLGSNNVSVLLGKGDGTFAAHVDYAAGSNPYSVTSADVNGDGKADLIVANFYGSNNVSVLLGKGDGTFAAHVDYDTGSNPRFVTSADVNGDGKADLIVANWGSNNVSVLINTANSTGLMGSVTELGTASGNSLLTSTGAINFSDVDLSDSHTVSAVAASSGTLGTLTAIVSTDDSHTTGLGGVVTWNYSVDNSKVQYLALGEFKVETFTVTLNDGHGGLVPSTVSVTITGTNDAPVIGTAVLSGAVTEQITPAGNLTSIGAINFSDVDLSDSHTVSAVAASSGTLGTLTASVSTDDSHTTGLGGVVTWAYSVADSAVEYLAAGQTKVETFTVSLNDGHGSVVPSTVSVTITGTNDAAVITGTASASLTETNAAQSTGGTLSATDVDSSAAFTAQTGVAGSNGYGSFAINTAGAWTYAMNSAHNEFAGGTNYTDSFTVATADGTTKVITVTISGTNDAAVITGTASASLTETNAAQSIGGTLSATDVDSSAAFTVQTGVAGSNGYGSFGINAAGAWTYAMNNAQNQFVSGTNYTDSFTVATADGTTKVITVTIAGTNDAPVMTGTMTDPLYAATNPAWGTFTNASGVWIAPNGSNDGDTLSHSVIRQFDASQAGIHTLKFSADNVGSVSIDGIAIDGLQGFTQYSSQATGSINLTAGKHTIVMDVQNYGGPAGFALTVADPTGNVIWNTRTQLDPVALVVAYTENQAAQAISAGLTIADIDSTQLISATVSIGNGFATGQDILGFANQNGISGSYNAASGVLGLSGSATVAQYQAALRSVSYSNSSDSPSTAARTVNFVVNDGASQFNLSNTVTSTVIVRAVNDVPIVATTDVTGSVTELASTPGTAKLTDSGTIAFTDADLTDTHSVSSVTPVAGALGTLTASVSTDSTGTGLGGVVTWNYSVADSAVEYLATGETKVETFGFNVLDGQGGSVARTITVTITGTNDAPVIGTPVLSGAVTEQVTPAGNLTSSGAINFSDVDLSDVHTVSAVAASSGTLGTLTASVSTDTNHTTGLGGVVTWAYSVDNAKVQYLAAGQTKVETFTVSLNDGHGSVVPSTVSVTITGTNNAPIATNDAFNGSVTGGVMTFEAGTYSGTYGSVFAGGFNFSNGANSGLFVHGDTHGTDGSAALFSSGGGPGPNMYMTHADGHAFSLQSANITSITDSYYSKATEVVTGYLNGVQVAQQAFTVPNYYIQHNNLVTFTAAGFNAVDNVLFSATGSSSGNGYQFIDNVNTGVIRPSYDDFNVLANDTDIDNGSTLSIANFSVVSTMGAAITLNANGTLHYDPTQAAGVQALAAGQAGTDTFTYVTKDEHGALSNTATVSVSVVGVNDAPAITSGAQTGSVSEGGGQPASSMTTTGHVTYSDVDLTDTHALSISTLAAHGSASVNAQGNWSYTLTDDATVNALTTGQHLSDSFTVLVDDLHGGKASQTVSIDITNIKDTNHAPVANPDSGVLINSNGSVPVSFTPIGSAFQNGTGSSEYVITQELNNQVGALWSNSKVSLNSSFSISAQLYFGTKDYDGADGFSFIVQNQSKTVIGSAGQGLGYAGITKSVGVEFDTYYNGGTTDPINGNDHMNINTGGLMNAIGGVIDLGNIEDGKYHDVSIDWAASTKMLSISFDKKFTETKYVDMVGEVGSAEAYIGFAGSTGGAVNLQKINTLSYKSVDSSVVLDVLANDTDVDTGDKAGLKVISAASTHGATVSFSGLAGAGITYSPGHAYDTLAIGSTATDTINYTIADSHGAVSSSMATITIVGVSHES